jgi:hypothetical protein
MGAENSEFLMKLPAIPPGHQNTAARWLVISQTITNDLPASFAGLARWLVVLPGARKKSQRSRCGICKQDFLSATTYGNEILDF